MKNMKKYLLVLLAAFTFQTIKAQGPITEICVVTVDTTFDHNIIVWERASQISAAGIDSMRIYTVTAVGADSLIATVDYDSLSEYHHMQADVDLHEWTYRIQGVDTLGVAGSLSVPHTTIHFTVTDNSSGNLFLEWTPYIGHTVDYYDCWMDSTGATNFDLINTTGSGAVTDWWHNTIPSTWQNTNYMVDVQWSISCTSTRAPHNSTRSNKTKPVAGPVSAKGNPTLSSLKVYPNPSNGQFNLSFSSLNWEDTFIKVIDMTGKVVMTLPTVKVLGTYNTQIDMSQLSDGIYTVSIQNQYYNLSKRLVLMK